MEHIKDYLKERGLLDRISFKGGAEHTVKLVNCQKETINDGNKDIVGMKVNVIEDGEKRSFFTASADLLTKLMDLPEGTTVSIKMISKNINGEFRSGFNVEKVIEHERSQELPPGEEYPSDL